jgi:hypothetical protein
MSGVARLGISELSFGGVFRHHKIYQVRNTGRMTTRPFMQEAEQLAEFDSVGSTATQGYLKS